VAVIETSDQENTLRLIWVGGERWKTNGGSAKGSQASVKGGPGRGPSSLEEGWREVHQKVNT